MTTARDAFLQRVRQAVAEGNRAGAAIPLEPRGTIGYQGGGTDPATRFCAELTGAGGQVHRVVDAAAAVRQVLDLALAKGARRILLGRGAFLDTLGLAERLRALGLEVSAIDTLSPPTCREPFFAADLGITGVDYLIAETGTVALLAGPTEPRSLSLLPPVHVAVAHTGQLLPDLFDLFAVERWRERAALPSCLSLVTGPSKTGDIELKLVTGVHGPGELHVVLTEA